MHSGKEKSSLKYFLRGNRIDAPLTWWDFQKPTVFIVVMVYVVILLYGLVMQMASWSNDEYRIAVEFQSKRDNFHQEKIQDAIQSCGYNTIPIDLFEICIKRKLVNFRNDFDLLDDLKAQMDMANWTRIMGLVSIIATIVSSIGLVFLYLSLRQTRQAIETDRTIGHAQVRAYLSAEIGVLSSLSETKQLYLDFKIKNTGQSPAHNVNYIAALMLRPPSSEQTEIEIYPDPRGEFRLGNVITSGGSIEGQAEKKDGLSKSEIELIRSGKENLYFFVKITYLDIFGRERKKPERITRFCARLDMEKSTKDPITGEYVDMYAWALAGRHNDAT